MGLFGKGFGTGLAQGLAEGATRTIQTALDKREEEASAARKYMQTRRIQESERYEQDMSEASELFEGFVQLTGGDMDKAAQLMKGAGGAEGRRTLLAELQAETRKNQDFNVLTAYNFAEAQAGEYGRDDYLRTLVRDPKSLALPQSKKIGLGLADKILGAEAKDMGISMPELRGQRIESLGTATAVPGAFSVAQEFEREAEAERIALATSKAGLLQKQKEIANMGGLTKAESRTYWKDSVSEAIKLAKLPINAATGEFDLSTAPEKLQEAKDAYGDALTDTIRYFKDTGTLNTADGQNQLKSFARNPFIDINRDAAGKAFTPLTKDGGFDYDKMELGKVYGVGTPTGDTAKYIFAGFDDEDKPLMLQLQ